MKHVELVERFKRLLKVRDESIDCWFPNGKGSVRVRMQDRTEMIYTYIGEYNWRLETVHSWLEGKKTS